MRHSVLPTLTILILSGGLLAGCETDGGAPGPQAELANSHAKKEEPAKPAEPPMTHSRAAMECWMKTEKGRADGNLDKRADVVTKCIDDKLNAAAAKS